MHCIHGRETFAPPASCRASERPSFASLLAGIAMFAVGLAISPAWAGDATEKVTQLGAEEPEEPPPLVPQVHVLGFEDLPGSGDCDPIAARFGRCVERVQFVPLGNVFAKGDRLSAYQRAHWRNVGTLYAELWEDLTYRWYDEQDVLLPTLHTTGVEALLPPSLEWDVTYRNGGPVFAIPDAKLWLPRSWWLSTRPEHPGVFGAVTYHPATLPGGNPASVVLAGRFALKLGYSGKPHPYNLMDATPASSAPFFEQMYPYVRALEGSNQEYVPLLHFQRLAEGGQRNLDDSQLFGPDPRAMREHAKAEFSTFSHLVALQIVRFGLEEYTPNHMKILAALTAMESPPGQLEHRTGQSSDIVAAAMGETDLDEEVEGRMAASVLSLEQGFRLDYYRLPLVLVEDYLRSLVEQGAATPDLIFQLNNVLVNDLADVLLSTTTPLASLTSADIQAWAAASARPGVSRTMVVEQVERRALQLLMWSLEEWRQDRMQTDMLLEHINLEVSSGFDSATGHFTSPAVLAEDTSKRWKSVLGSHGFRPIPIEQGLGSVDPTAVCTTRERREALKEPVFGVVHLDLLFAQEDGAEDPTELLWSAREGLPFIMLDDPTRAVPEVHRLVGLPDGQALYRARWNIWSGWHFFWNAGAVDERGDAQALELRTGAVCADTVLAAPELVPTILRAGMLEGNMRATEAVRRRQERRHRRGAGVEADEAVDSVTDGSEQASDNARTAQVITEASEEDPSRVTMGVDIGLGKIQGLAHRKRLAVTAETQEAAAYLQALARRPLEELAASDGHAAVVVFDSTDAQPPRAMHDRRPATPYARTQSWTRRLGRAQRGHVRTATWTWYQPGVADEPPTLIAPAYNPTESVVADATRAHWRRLHTGSYTIATGLGFLPLRTWQTTCNKAIELPSTVACEEGELWNEGFGLDGAFLATWWAIDDFRLGLEIGPEVRVDLGHGGQSWFWKEKDAKVNAWTVRPQAGLLGGIRFAPDPIHLGGRLGSPWGAERNDGGSRLGRIQYGLRVGYLFTAGYNGTEGTALAEAWAGRSVRSSQSRYASFTPYNPRMLIGPFVRGEYDMVLVPAEDRVKGPDHGYAIMVGVRAQMRTQAEDVELPEVQ
ncbi:MAG: hypothetical protein ABIO70_25005 [Pseudomonadota bacterium]